MHTPRRWVPRRRLAIVAAWAAAIALLVSTCVGQGAGSSLSASTAGATATPMVSALGSSAALQRYADDSISFDYPASWQQRKGSINPSGNFPIVFVSPQDLPSDCEPTSGGGGVCGPWPFMHLAAGGIVIAWRFDGMPGSAAPTAGTPILVGSRPAWRSVAPADSGCASIGGDESINVALPATPAENGWIGVDACLTGPSHQPGEAAFAAIIASAIVP